MPGLIRRADHALFQLMLGDLAAFRAHMDGLQSIVKLRGGINALAMRPVGRILRSLVAG